MAIREASCNPLSAVLAFSDGDSADRAIRYDRHAGERMTPSSRTNSFAVRRAALSIAVTWICLASVVAQEELPTDHLLRSLQPTADVNDLAGILTLDEKASLEARCRKLREKTGAQLAVVTLKSLEG